MTSELSVPLSKPVRGAGAGCSYASLRFNPA